MDEPRAPERKLAEARALWEIALIYIALGAAARTLTSAGSPQQIAAAGYQAAALLARAYYRLIRAAWTGFTIVGQDDGAGEQTSLLALYREFEEQAFAAIPSSKHADTRRRMSAAGFGDDTATDGLVDESDSPEDRYPTEGVIADLEAETPSPGDSREEGWPSARDIIVEAVEDFEESAREDEENAHGALRDLERMLAKAREAERKRERKAARDISSRRAQELAARRRSQARVERAGATMKTAQDGARDTINALANRDQRAIGWVRVTHSPTPCGWCLMLASRGIILYKSAASARSAWHENCHCTAEPVFSRDHYFTSPQFAKNRALYKIWQEQGYGKGPQGERDFRNHFRRRYANGVNLHTILRENAERH